MKTFSTLTLAFLLLSSAIITSTIDFLLDDSYYETLCNAAERTMTGWCDGGALRATIFVLVMAFGWASMEWGGMGSASFGDMQRDVMDALAWLDANDDVLGLYRVEEDVGGGGSSSIGDGGRRTSKRRKHPFVFGGYSSGGHVAATVIQDASLWRERNLPEPHAHFDTILYISPVLSTRSYHDDLAMRNKWPSLASSSTSSLTSTPGMAESSMSEDEASPSTSSHGEEGATSTAAASSSLSSFSAPPPTWLTDRVVRAVFGHTAASAIPSPIHTYDRSPSVPHVFLGCETEMFGLTWLDSFFCSSDYSDLLRGVGVDSRYRSIRSDHWNILGSAGLRCALGEELGRIKRECGVEKVR